MREVVGLLVAVLSGAACAGYLLWWVAIKPWWYGLNNQREILGRHLAYVLADYVLHRAFDFSHITTTADGEQIVKRVHFVTPYRDGVTLAADDATRYFTKNNHPESYLKVWDWSTGLDSLPLAYVNLELDTDRLPYDTSIDYLLEHRQDIEEHAFAVLVNYGVIAVKLHRWTARDREHNKQRIIFKLIFRRRDKGPEIPQHVDYREMIATWGDFERERGKYTRLELFERDRLTARILDYAITNCGATFPLKKLQAAFASEISHRQIESLGLELEAAGLLVRQSGPLPRVIVVAKARECIEKYLPSRVGVAVPEYVCAQTLDKCHITPYNAIYE